MRITAIIFAVALGAAAARADDLVLTDGRFIPNVEVSETEGGYTVHFDNGDVFVPAEMVKECYFVDEAGEFVPRTEEEKKKAERGLVPFQGRWVRKSRRDRELAERREQAREKFEELRQHQHWRNRYITKTRNFQFEYTLDPDIFQEYIDLMETYYKVFTKQWRIRRPSKLGRLKVCFYHDYETFLQVSGTSRGVQGYYRFFPLDHLELNFYYNRLDPEYTTEVMFHEANHYLTHLIDLSFRYPHCINEAMAEYYGASKWDPDEKEMTVGGMLEGRVTEVLTDMQGGEMQSLEAYLRNELGYKDYTWGWTFVHMMMENREYERRFKSFFIGLAKDPACERRNGTVTGKDLLDYFMKKMGIRDMEELEELEQEWYDYIREEFQLQSHRGYEKAARRLEMTGQRIKAKRFYKKAIDDGSKNPRVYIRYAELIDDTDEAIELMKKATELAPLTARVWAQMGRFLLRKPGEENKKEGKRLLRLATEIDPDDPTLRLTADIEAALNSD